MSQAPSSTIQHALVVNGGKMAPYERLRERWPDVRLSVVTEPQHQHRYADLQDVRLVKDLHDLESVRDAALQVLAESGPVDAVFAPSERMIPVGGFLRAFLGLPGYGFDESVACTNKFAMKERLRRAGVPVARSTLAPTAEDVVGQVERGGSRAVVKPAFGIGASYTHVVDPGSAALDDAVADLRGTPGPFVVEEWIDVVDELHCDGLVRDGRVLMASVAQYFTPVLRSAGTLWGSFTVRDGEPHDAEVRALHERAVAALGPHDGVTHLEVLVAHDGRHLVGEMACRPGGGGVPRMLRRAYGLETMDSFLDANLGIAPTLPAAPQGAGNDRVVAWCQLPVREGTVVDVTSAAVLREVPGVVDVELTAMPGTVYSAPIYSTTSAGIVLLDVEDRAALERSVHLLRDRYDLTVSPEERKPS